MAFYKLYFIIHRRTDWERLLEWERKIMMPEWYEEKHKRAMQSLQKLSMVYGLVSALNSPYL